MNEGVLVMRPDEWSVTDAWHAAQDPRAIAEAIKIGEQITGLLAEATSLVERACRDVDFFVDHASLRCHKILGQLAREAARLAPVLARLHAASKAVKP
jgi:hypothetical protein